MINSGATVQLAGTGGDQIYDGSGGVTLNTGGTFDLNGRSEAIPFLNGNGTVTNSNATTLSVLTVGTTTNNNSFFTGVIQDGAGQVALAKAGTGTFNMAGTFGYTGNTTITAGVLSVGNTTACHRSPRLQLYLQQPQRGGHLHQRQHHRHRPHDQHHRHPDLQRPHHGGNISSVTYTGTGTETISGASSYTGNTTILPAASS